MLFVGEQYDDKPSAENVEFLDLKALGESLNQCVTADFLRPLPEAFFFLGSSSLNERA